MGSMESCVILLWRYCVCRPVRWGNQVLVTTELKNCFAKMTLQDVSFITYGRTAVLRDVSYVGILNFFGFSLFESSIVRDFTSFKNGIRR